MPSRKKAKGKARKAAKEAKASAKEDESHTVDVAANQQQGEILEAQMQRLIIDAVSPKLCRHGCPSLPPGDQKICEDFINAFFAIGATQGDVVKAFLAATEATQEKYGEMYSAKKLETVITMLVAHGTQRILKGDKNTAQLYASLASYLKEYIAVAVNKSKAYVVITKFVELYVADDHTLVSFYRKRISCSCLDEKYKEVKSVKKMGMCYNPSCSQPRCVERSKSFTCTRCGDVNYCSVECQKADWKNHKRSCDIAVEMKAALKSNQS